MTTLPDLEPAARETLHDELKRLIGEYEDDDAGEATKAEAWNLIADFVVENSKAVLSALAAARSTAPEATGKSISQWVRETIDQANREPPKPDTPLAQDIHEIVDAVEAWRKSQRSVPEAGKAVVKRLPIPDGVSMTGGLICLGYEDNDERDLAYDALEAYGAGDISALASVPEAGKAVDGLVLVPREPTPEMVSAGMGEIPEDGSEYDDIEDAWRAMIAAAPAALASVPAPSGAEPAWQDRTGAPIAPIVMTAMVEAYEFAYAEELRRFGKAWRAKGHDPNREAIRRGLAAVFTALAVMPQAVPAEDIAGLVRKLINIADRLKLSKRADLHAICGDVREAAASLTSLSQQLEAKEQP